MRPSTDLWDSVWRGTEVTLPHDTVLSTIRKLHVETILEVGAGSGTDIRALDREGYRVSFGDFSKVAAVKFAIGRPDVPTYLLDTRYLPFADNTFDLVLSLGLLEHFSEEERALVLREQFRVARRYLLVDVPQKYAAAYLIKKLMMALGKWPYGEETEFSYWELKAEIGRVLPQTRVRSQYGRELVPFPRKWKNRVYRLFPKTLRELYVGSHRHFALALGGSLGLVMDKQTSEGRQDLRRG